MSTLSTLFFKPFATGCVDSADSVDSFSAYPGRRSPRNAICDRPKSSVTSRKR